VINKYFDVYFPRAIKTANTLKAQNAGLSYVWTTQVRSLALQAMPSAAQHSAPSICSSWPDWQTVRCHACCHHDSCAAEESQLIFEPFWHMRLVCHKWRASQHPWVIPQSNLLCNCTCHCCTPTARRTDIIRRIMYWWGREACQPDTGERKG